jgi:hypothetical protein
MISHRRSPLLRFLRYLRWLEAHRLRAMVHLRSGWF